MATFLEMRDITKEFPGVKALDRVSMTVEQAVETYLARHGLEPSDRNGPQVP